MRWARVRVLGARDALVREDFGLFPALIIPLATAALNAAAVFSLWYALKLSSVSRLKSAGVIVHLSRWLRWFYRCSHVLVIIECAKFCV